MSKQAVTRRVFARRIETNEAPRVTDLKGEIKTRLEKFYKARVGWEKARAAARAARANGTYTPAHGIERDHWLAEMEKHRVTRGLHLAHCYLKGRTYKQCEQKCQNNKYLYLEITRHLSGDYETNTHLIQTWIVQGDSNRWDIEFLSDETAAVKNAQGKLNMVTRGFEQAAKDLDQAHLMAENARKRMHSFQETIEARKADLKVAEEALQNKKAALRSQRVA